MEKTNKILTIAGKRVIEVLDGGRDEPCAECCLYGECCIADIPFCDGRNIHFVRAEESGERDIREKAEIIKAIIEAKGFRYTHDEMMRMTKKELLAYYKEIEGTPQEVTLIPSNEDADKASEEACAKCPISGRCFVEDKGRKDACDYLRGVKAGIAYERERLMKKGDDELEKMIDDFEDWDGSYSRADLPTSYTTRDIARFFANWERERLMKEAVGCMFSFTEDKTPCLLIGDGYALRVNAKKGDYFEAIIIKKEK